VPIGQLWLISLSQIQNGKKETGPMPLEAEWSLLTAMFDQLPGTGAGG